ncbi:MAG: hypothetical protein IPH93_03140 [Saprospiraceae bacterium]|nr:hypothetical protein [Saprospiraceae bacterium]
MMKLLEYLFSTFVFLWFLGCSPEDDAQCVHKNVSSYGNECSLINTNPNSKYFNQYIGSVKEISFWKIPIDKVKCDAILSYSGIVIYNNTADTIKCRVLSKILIDNKHLVLFTSINPLDSFTVFDCIPNCADLSKIEFLN